MGASTDMGTDSCWPSCARWIPLVWSWCADRAPTSGYSQCYRVRCDLVYCDLAEIIKLVGAIHPPEPSNPPPVQPTTGQQRLAAGLRHRRSKNIACGAFLLSRSRVAIAATPAPPPGRACI